MSKTPFVELSIDMQSAITQLLKIANAEKYYLIGLLFREDSIAIIRNTNDDTAEAFQAAAELITDKRRAGLVVETHVRPPA